MTFADYARYRLSVFTREEAGAIVAYLNYTREIDIHGINTPQIVEALNVFWLDRAERAPSRESLKTHLREESEFMAQTGPEIVFSRSAASILIVNSHSRHLWERAR